MKGQKTVRSICILAILFIIAEATQHSNRNAVRPKRESLLSVLASKKPCLTKCKSSMEFESRLNRKRRSEEEESSQFQAEFKFLEKWTPSMDDTSSSAYRLIKGNIMDAITEQLSGDKRFSSAKILKLRHGRGAVVAKVSLKFKRNEHNPMSHIKFLVSTGHISSLKVDKKYLKLKKTKVVPAEDAPTGAPTNPPTNAVSADNWSAPGYSNEPQTWDQFQANQLPAPSLDQSFQNQSTTDRPEDKPSQTSAVALSQPNPSTIDLQADNTNQATNNVQQQAQPQSDVRNEPADQTSEASVTPAATVTPYQAQDQPQTTQPANLYQDDSKPVTQSPTPAPYQYDGQAYDAVRPSAAPSQYQTQSQFNNDNTEQNERQYQTQLPVQAQTKAHIEKSHGDKSARKIYFKMNQNWFPFLKNHKSIQYKMVTRNIDKGLKSVMDGKSIAKVQNLIKAESGSTEVQLSINSFKKNEKVVEKLKKAVKSGDVAGIPVDGDFFEVKAT